MSEMVATEILKGMLPSGSEAKYSELTVGDANRLANPKRREQALQDILRNRVKILNEDGEEETFNTETSLIADLFASMIMVRRVTHGEMFEFEAKCPECRKKSTHEIDLSDEKFNPKYVKWADDGDLEKGVDRKTFEFVIALEKPYQGIDKIRFRLLRGRDQQKFQNIRENMSDKIASENMKMKIVYFEGKINPADKDKAPEHQRKMKPTDKWLLDMPLRVQREITKKYDNFDGGVEGTVEVECARCGESNDVVVPFSTAGFFSPS